MNKENSENLEISNAKKNYYPKTIYTNNDLDKNTTKTHNNPSDISSCEIERNLKKTDFLNENRNREIRRKSKQLKKLYFSTKYTVFIIILWLVFTAAFIVGFIVNFDVKTSMNASSIIWSFSAFIAVIATVYTVIYFKAKNSTNFQNLEKFLKFFPI